MDDDLFYLAFYGLSAHDQSKMSDGWLGVVKFVFGTIAAFAAMGGAVGTSIYGWYGGLETVLFFAIAIAALSGVGILAFTGIQATIRRIGKIIRQRASQKAATQSQEPRSDRRANLPCREYAHKLKGYLEADDIPDDPAT